jgi:uncharacterized membrane protein
MLSFTTIKELCKFLIISISIVIFPQNLLLLVANCGSGFTLKQIDLRHPATDGSRIWMVATFAGCMERGIISHAVSGPA